MHARAMTVELLRYPAYLVPTLLLPTVFFLFFVSPGPRVAATARMATFAGFAVIGVAFFQFGVGIAIDRASPWEAYLRTLPVGPPVAARGAPRLGCDLRLRRRGAPRRHRGRRRPAPRSPAARWACLAVALLAGTVPFACLGIALGYWAPPKAALPIANLLYLVLAYAGGLWTRPSTPPARASRASPASSRREPTPTRSSPRRSGCGIAWRSWLALAGFTALFGRARRRRLPAGRGAPLLVTCRVPRTRAAGCPTLPAP